MHNRHLVDLVRDQHPLTMPPDGSVAEACAAMHRRRVGAMLVVDEAHHLLGIFTGRDALRCLAEHANPGSMPLRASGVDEAGSFGARRVLRGDDGGDDAS